MTLCWPDVVVATPAHSGLAGALSYRSERMLTPGMLVRVPLGHREVPGIVWACHSTPPDHVPADQLRPVSEVLEGLTPLNRAWRGLVSFTARYYQRGLGEVALAALPPTLRDLETQGLARHLKPPKPGKRTTAPGLSGEEPPPRLSAEQEAALQALEGASRPVLLFGSTGSGKTEVYLRAVERVLAQDPQAQALVMVPEINLTPQLETRFRARFGTLYGPESVACLHSGMTPVQRLKAWLAAHQGPARVLLGTRMAIFASLPGLRLIVVDEEHDPSYKSQDGARHSARDLAVYRAKLEATEQERPCQVLLGSATPSLESWHAAEQGRYLRLNMPGRIGGGSWPRLRLVDMGQQPKGAPIAPPLLAALRERLARGEQSLVLLNRRGYAPVLACEACGWKSACPHCSAYRVYHKQDRSLRCHHCGQGASVPRACPDCGNLDIAPLGRGTEQLEEQLSALLSDAPRPEGLGARVARLDADTTRKQGSLEQQLNALHRGEVDILVGTQMIAKGHDFRRITLVASVNTDAALFAADHRAPERLFSLLMQASGRAGRDAAQSSCAEMWVQTWHPSHPLFAALARHDYPGFAQAQLTERAAAQMPPFSHQALLRAEARSQESAQTFLKAASQVIAAQAQAHGVLVYPPVPQAMARIANIERAQMLLESGQRTALQQVLRHLSIGLQSLRHQPAAHGLVRFAIDVDPHSL